MIDQTPTTPAANEPPQKQSKVNMAPKKNGAIKLIPLSSSTPNKTVKIEVGFCHALKFPLLFALKKIG